MPLVANTDLPSFHRLAAEGEEVIDLDRARRQDIRELHIGLLNMMPDAALEVTERQFMRLIGSCNRIVQFYLHPFSVPEIPRSEGSRQHIASHYRSFEEIRQEGLDALIVTGAIPGESMVDEPFWKPLGEVFDWASDHVTSTLCACLATHGAMKYFHDQDRQRLPDKKWGVYEHRVVANHPLVRDINTRFDVPHSRFNEITAKQFEQAGARVLVESDKAGVHLAVSGDLLRFVYFQGHPEYDRNSLLKEYKREIGRFLNGEIDEYPPMPQHYFGEDAQALLGRYRSMLMDDDVDGEEFRDAENPLDRFPERRALAHCDNTWRDTAKSVVNNWLGLVYQLTHEQRGKPFMDGVDPASPLDSLSGGY